MTGGRYALLAAAFLFFYLGAWFTELDLGGFGNGLLIIAAVFGLLAVVTQNSKGSTNG